MKTNTIRFAAIVGAVSAALTSSAFAVSTTYFGPTGASSATRTADFVNPSWWGSAPAGTTTFQQWDNFTSGAGTATITTTFDGYNGYSNGGLATPTVNAAGLNSAIYIFNQSAAAVNVPNYGGAFGSVSGGMLVTVQIASTVGANDAMNPSALDYAIIPNSLKITKADGITAVTGGAAGDATVETIASYQGTFEFLPGFPVKGEHYRYSFFLPDWTGDIKVTWTQQNHTVLDAIRVDTQVVPEPTSLAFVAGAVGLGLLRRGHRGCVPLS
jgi:hypothetical protein